MKQRKAFGQRVMDFQNTQFKLAECPTKAMVARTVVDQCPLWHMRGRLDAGDMNECPISRMYTEARVQRIYVGTNEIMKVLIARGL